MDKLLHFLTSYFIYTATQSITHSLPLALCVTLVIGIGKELYDSLGYGDCDWKDMVANVAGIVVGIMII